MLYYMYGITSAENPLSSMGLDATGRVVCSDLAALVEPVPEAEFAPEALEQSLSSLEWIARTARRHQSVLEAAMAGGPVVPARLCTLFSHPEAVERYLAGDRERFASTLQRLVGRSEWGVKVFCDEARVGSLVSEVDPEILALSQQVVSASPGRAYVLLKKRDARRETLRRERIDAVLEGVEDELLSLPISICHKSLLSREITGRTEPMVMNLAALVGDEELMAYHAAVQVLADSLAPHGFVFETSGPWPPYSFCDEGDDGDLDEADLEPAVRYAQTGS